MTFWLNLHYFTVQSWTVFNDYTPYTFQVHYPMELHLVHYNTALGKTFKSALGTKAYNALAVLGIMFQIQEEDNPKLQEFTQSKDCI